MTTPPAALAAAPTRAALDALRPYLVNLTDGKLSTTGAATTSQQDIDDMIAIHLPEFVARHGGHQVPVVAWAHGGLVSEAAGLAIAERQVEWWLDNGVYPIFFVWESGIEDALRQLLGSASAASRGFGEDLLDRITEQVAHNLGGTKIWSAMKRSADLASAPDGGARYVAQRLRQYMAANPSAVRLHAVGHSAGAVFQAGFVPAVVGTGDIPVASLSLLAPAIRVDDFLRTLRPLVNNGIAELAMFSMHRELEESDTVSAGPLTIYHRSLLYLIRAALENDRNTPILGLEECLQSSPELSALFATAAARAVWSRTADGAPPSDRSLSTSHGGFDEDPSTMDSLAYRITKGTSTVPYPRASLPRASEALVPTTGPVIPAATTGHPSARQGAGKGRSIHIGLNHVDPAKYDGWSGKLNACEADARDMAAIADSRGFAGTVILSAEATSRRILKELATAAGELGAGDTLVVSYSGHGGQIPDVDGDEPDGQDETWVLYDRQLLDDELYAAFSRFAPDVRIAVFSDSCHSGTVTRAAPPLPDGFTNSAVAPPSIPRGARPRNMPAALCQRDFLRRNKQYKKIAAKSAGVDAADIAPCVLLISGCADNQLSLDGTHNGLFTATLLTVWNGGHFQGGYPALHKSILDRMPESQSPKLSVVGRYDKEFVRGPVFTH